MLFAVLLVIHALPHILHHLNVQTIASPFQFERLLTGVDAVPYIFDSVMTQWDEEDAAAASGPVAARLPAWSLSEVLKLMGDKVIAILGHQVKKANIGLLHRRLHAYQCS